MKEGWGGGERNGGWVGEEWGNWWERNGGWKGEEWGLGGRGIGVGRERKGRLEGEIGGLGGRGMGMGGVYVLYTSAKLTTESECVPVVCVQVTAGGHRCDLCVIGVGILTTS